MRFSGAPVLGTDEEVQALLQIERSLQSVGVFWMDVCSAVKTARSATNWLRYRANLVRLRHELAIMQSAALSCRERLALRQKHLQAAKAWVYGLARHFMTA